MNQPDLFNQPPLEIAKHIHFDGSDIVPELDNERLTGQMLNIYNTMKSSEWKTLAEIEKETGHPQASISAQLRNLRKKRFGSHTVEKRRRGEEKNGLFEYRIILNSIK